LHFVLATLFDVRALNINAGSIQAADQWTLSEIEGYIGCGLLKDLLLFLFS